MASRFGDEAVATADALKAGVSRFGDAPVDSPAPESAVSRFLSPMNPMNLVHAILKPSDDPNEHPLATFGKNIKAVVGNLLDAQQRERDAMHESIKQGDYKSAVAHGLSALTPILGPMSQDAAEKFSSGDTAGGLGTLTSMAYPELMKGAAALAKVAAPVAATTAGIVADAARSPVVREVVGVVSPRAKNLLNLSDKIQTAGEKARGTGATQGPPTRQVGPASLDQPVVPRTPQFDEMPPVRPAPGPPMAGPVPMARPEADGLMWPGEMNGPQMPSPAPQLPGSAAQPVTPAPRGVVQAQALADELAKTTAKASEETQVESLAYKMQGQAEKARHIADVLNQAGITADEMEKASGAHWKAATDAANLKFGVNHDVPSKTTIPRTLFEMRRLEKAAPIAADLKAAMGQQ